MSDIERKIIVRENYNDAKYRDFLWRSFKLEYEKDKVRGRTRFVEEVIWQTIDKYIDNIQLKSNAEYKFQYFTHYKDYRDITNYLKTGKTPSTKSDTLFLREIDAFMQIKVRKFNSLYIEAESDDEIGILLGAYLRDPILGTDRYRLSATGQTIIGIYKYENVDTHNHNLNEIRMIAFIAGNNIDYLQIIDFAYSPEKLNSEKADYKLDIVQGFCIPGEKVSLVILKTKRFKERQLGLIYSPGNLVDMSGGVLDDLVYEVFTTNMDRQGDRTNEDKYKDNLLIAKALNIHYGPRLRKNLIIVNNQEKHSVERFISKISLNMI